jgi:glycosyltransferase involved in cell wall biosynthesis
MRVLLVATDLYKTAGGGETVYRKLIFANPEIEFVYFRDAEPSGAARPANARSVLLKVRRTLQVSQPFFQATHLDNLQSADAIARSVAGEEFDVVELPDYFTFGVFLRDCFARHRVKFGALVLAMHGNISTSVDLGWDSVGDATFVQRQLEFAQFVDADARYAISKRYMAEWQARSNLEIHYVDPLSIVGPPNPVAWVPNRDAPELYCIGRMERRKGNDLFIEILRWIDPSLYGRACHVGSTVYSRNGDSSERILRNIAEAREVRPDFLPAQDKVGLTSIYGRNSIIVLPVRYDSFNLVAIEALFSGCPVVVSDAAGVCDYLDSELPGVPYVKLELTNLYGVVAQIEHILRDYAPYRKQLLERLSELRLTKPAPDLHPIYESALAHGRAAETSGVRRRSVQFIERRSSIRDRMLAGARKVILDRLRQPLKRLVRKPRGALSGMLTRLRLFRITKLGWHALSSIRLSSKFRKINLHWERNLDSVGEKVRLIHSVTTGPIYRCNIWRELARLERLRGNELVAIAYELRLMRLLGGDVFGQLPAVKASLESNGFCQEALACDALYGSPAGADARVHEYLQAAFQRSLRNAQKDWALLDDRRRGTPKVSVIVSLYNAAPKLKLFLTALSRQTLVRKGAVEIVLVDSGSKTNEYEIAKEFLAGHSLDVVYGRSEQRETIQAAWNRGIHLSRAPYLVFLGADETLYPEALETLAAELDRNSSVDWVMANSLVTAVDRHGVFKKDVMPYDRSGGTKDHTYLETCYLSWVGGMYRKSIHERYGYYDETFRAAGDTEFKNRVLPYINVRFVPRTLGLFLNYPDDRTTASPVAEIEDTRAWYLHRTPGGVRYAFENRNPSDALGLFYAALGYRKSYCRHISSDVEYAGYLLEYARDAGLGTELAPVSEDLAGLLTSFRQLEWTESNFSVLASASRLVRTWREARRDEHAHAKLLAGKASPTYSVLNDNRFEQHSWLWKTF